MDLGSLLLITFVVGCFLGSVEAALGLLLLGGIVVGIGYSVLMSPIFIPVLVIGGGYLLWFGCKEAIKEMIKEEKERKNIELTEEEKEQEIKEWNLFKLQMFFLALLFLAVAVDDLFDYLAQ